MLVCQFREVGIFSMNDRNLNCVKAELQQERI